MSRFFSGRFAARITSSWQLYPLGALFGLGFDTASEVGLLALAAGVATRRVPFLAVVSLAFLFAAGMSLMDTADRAFMSRAYGWAFSNPARRIYYNVTVTSLSVAVALLIGTIELLQVAAGRLGLDGAFWSLMNSLDLDRIGYGVVALFGLTWASAAVLWRIAHLDKRWNNLLDGRPSE
jgi:nickel/cobalt transporter (NiCoT) family protein